MIQNKIKIYLEDNGVKLSWLSEATGIAIYALSNIVNGKRKVTAEELFKISKALKVSPEIFEPEE
jgi:plasmid maintenance system antidote protein VapI